MLNARLIVSGKRCSVISGRLRAVAQRRDVLPALVAEDRVEMASNGVTASPATSRNSLSVRSMKWVHT
jgi:hypothetical protein